MLDRLDAMTDADIIFDRDSPRTFPGDWDGATMKRGGVVIGTTPRRRGPNKNPTKQPVLLRIDPGVLARWKATGTGWQTRMAAALAKLAPALKATTSSPSPVPVMQTKPEPAKAAKAKLAKRKDIA